MSTQLSLSSATINAELSAPCPAGPLFMPIEVPIGTEFDVSIKLHHIVSALEPSVFPDLDVERDFELKSISTFQFRNNTDTHLIFTPGTVIKGANTQDRVLVDFAVAYAGEMMDFKKALCGHLRSACVGKLEKSGLLLPLHSQRPHNPQQARGDGDGYAARRSSYTNEFDPQAMQRSGVFERLEVLSAVEEEALNPAFQEVQLFFQHQFYFSVDDDDRGRQQAQIRLLIQVEGPYARSLLHAALDMAGGRSAFDYDEQPPRLLKADMYDPQHVLETIRSLLERATPRYQERQRSSLPSGLAERLQRIITAFKAFALSLNRATFLTLYEAWKYLTSWDHLQEMGGARGMHFSRGGPARARHPWLDPRRSHAMPAQMSQAQLVDFRRSAFPAGDPSLQSKLWAWTSGSIFNLLRDAPVTNPISVPKTPTEIGMMVLEPSGHYYLHMAGTPAAWESYRKHFLLASTRLYESRPGGLDPGSMFKFRAKVLQQLDKYRSKTSETKPDWGDSSDRRTLIVRHASDDGSYSATEVYMRSDRGNVLLFASVNGYLSPTTASGGSD